MHGIGKVTMEGETVKTRCENGMPISYFVDDLEILSPFKQIKSLVDSGKRNISYKAKLIDGKLVPYDFETE